MMQAYSPGYSVTFLSQTPPSLPISMRRCALLYLGAFSHRKWIDRNKIRFMCSIRQGGDSFQSDRNSVVQGKADQQFGKDDAKRIDKSPRESQRDTNRLANSLQALGAVSSKPEEQFRKDEGKQADGEEIESQRDVNPLIKSVRTLDEDRIVDNKSIKAETKRIDREAIDLQRDMNQLVKSVQTLGAVSEKPEVCTAEELHYVAVPGTGWKLALWRYPPSVQAQKRNHPVLLLSGVGTNAIGFDLEPSVSLARFMAEAGFDTWILEVRGAGLSRREVKSPVSQVSDNNGAVTEESTKLNKDNSEPEVDATVSEKPDKSSWTSLSVANTLTNNIARLTEGLRNLLNDGHSRTLSARLAERLLRILEDFQLSERYTEVKERLTHILEERQSSAISAQLTDLSKRLSKLLEEGQRSVSPQFNNLQERIVSTVDDFQKLLELIIQYDWDFDNYLEEDVPAAIDYILSQSKPRDGKVHALGHSMGGIILYALLAVGGEDCRLASSVTLASSLDYGVSDSSLKLLLPLADPAQIMNVPAVPLGALMAAIHPLANSPPHLLAWLNSQVSARDMMDPKHFKKLVLNNFCTIPVKLLLQLSTLFQSGGLRSRSGAYFYKENLWRCKTPVLAIAGDEDLICPPSAVLDTVKELPQDLVTYQLFGGQNDQHYGHYDLVCGLKAREEVHPLVKDFFVQYDDLQIEDISNTIHSTDTRQV